MERLIEVVSLRGHADESKPREKEEGHEGKYEFK